MSIGVETQFIPGFTVLTGDQGIQGLGGGGGNGTNTIPYIPLQTQPQGEVRVVDPNTGGEKGAKLQRFSLIPTRFLWELAAHYGKGAKKYADRNWERGYKWSLSEDAAMRHYNLWRGGERFDAETGTHHLIAAAWHLIALFIFDDRKIGTDDLTTLGDTPQ